MRMNVFSFRVMQDRREQARQDLKGLEETVVSSSKYVPKEMELLAFFLQK